MTYERYWWTMVEPGWWWHTVHNAAVCLEDDGRWHVYVTAERPPGDSRHRTMRLAMRAAARLLRRLKR